jgi:hypothetical protein
MNTLRYYLNLNRLKESSSLPAISALYFKYYTPRLFIIAEMKFLQFQLIYIFFIYLG